MIYGFISTGFATRAQLSSEELEDESLVGTIWTWIDVSDEPGPPEDWQFIEGGILITLRNSQRNNTWVKNSSSVVITINDNYSTYTLQIINKNLTGLEWPVELIKK